MRWSIVVLATGVLAAVLTAATPVAAQVVVDPVEDLDFNRPESWAQKYFTSVTMVTGFGASRARVPWSVDIGVEGGWVPSLTEAQRTVGFDGTKTEDLNKTDVFGRLEVTAWFPAKLSATLVYTPPVEIGGATPNLLGLALGRPLYESHHARVGARLHGQTGTIEGDFTCSSEQAAAGDDPALNPYGCEEASNDRFTTRYLGLEIAASFPLRGGAVEPWVSGSANWLDTEFQVNARFAGIVDRTLLRTEGWTGYLTAGADVSLSEHWRLAAELFYSRLEIARPPDRVVNHDDLFNVRLLVRWNVR